ncbi:uncharacterized protein V1510DRAFT_413509 [Dipodascopsis tothii]|uniref:uncharacterized protein n=1 Tax=Dipodascopsis tothii TaxID=44089 RepID=UPI0034CFF41D
MCVRAFHAFAAARRVPCACHRQRYIMPPVVYNAAAGPRWASCNLAMQTIKPTTYTVGYPPVSPAVLAAVQFVSERCHSCVYSRVHYITAHDCAVNAYCKCHYHSCLSPTYHGHHDVCCHVHPVGVQTGTIASSSLADIANKLPQVANQVASTPGYGIVWAQWPRLSWAILEHATFSGCNALLLRNKDGILAFFVGPEPEVKGTFTVESDGIDWTFSYWLMPESEKHLVTISTCDPSHYAFRGRYTTSTDSHSIHVTFGS